MFDVFKCDKIILGTFKCDKITLAVFKYDKNNLMYMYLLKQENIMCVAIIKGDKFHQLCCLYI